MIVLNSCDYGPCQYWRKHIINGVTGHLLNEVVVTAHRSDLPDRKTSLGVLASLCESFFRSFYKCQQSETIVYELNVKTEYGVANGPVIRTG